MGSNYKLGLAGGTILVMAGLGLGYLDLRNYPRFDVREYITNRDILLETTIGDVLGRDYDKDGKIDVFDTTGLNWRNASTLERQLQSYYDSWLAERSGWPEAE